MRIGARRAAATLFALALLAPAVAHASIPNDPEFAAPAAGCTPWAQQIRWTPPTADVGWPMIAVVDSGLWSGFDDFRATSTTRAPTACTDRRARADQRVRTQVDDADGHGTRVATHRRRTGERQGHGRRVARLAADRRQAVTNATGTLQRGLRLQLPRGIARSGQLLVVNLSFTIGADAGRAGRTPEPDPCRRAGGRRHPATRHAPVPAGRPASRTCSRSAAATATPRIGGRPAARPRRARRQPAAARRARRGSGSTGDRRRARRSRRRSWPAWRRGCGVPTTTSAIRR